MTDDRISAETFEDLYIGDLTPREACAVARGLNAGADCVLVVEDWLVEDTDIESIDGETRIFSGAVERETEKAWLFATGHVEDWIPKSLSLCFERDADEIETPQQKLTAFKHEETEDSGEANPQVEQAQRLIDDHSNETGHDNAYRVNIGQYTPIVTVYCYECETTLV